MNTLQLHIYLIVISFQSRVYLLLWIGFKYWTSIYTYIKNCRLQLQSSLNFTFVDTVATILHAVVILVWISYSALMRVNKSTVNPTEYLNLIGHACTLFMHLRWLQFFYILTWNKMQLQLTNASYVEKIVSINLMNKWHWL